MFFATAAEPARQVQALQLQDGSPRHWRRWDGGTTRPGECRQQADRSAQCLMLQRLRGAVAWVLREPVLHRAGSVTISDRDCSFLAGRPHPARGQEQSAMPKVLEGKRAGAEEHVRTGSGAARGAQLGSSAARSWVQPCCCTSWHQCGSTGP